MAPFPTPFRGILNPAQISGGNPNNMGLTRTAGGFAWKVLISFLLFAVAAGSTLPQEPAAKRSATSKTISKSDNRSSQDTFTIVGAGDIVGCSDLSSAEATAKLVDAIPGTVFA